MGPELRPKPGVDDGKTLENDLRGAGAGAKNRLSLVSDLVVLEFAHLRRSIVRAQVTAYISSASSALLEDVSTCLMNREIRRLGQDGSSSNPGFPARFGAEVRR